MPRLYFGISLTTLCRVVKMSERLSRSYAWKVSVHTKKMWRERGGQIPNDDIGRLGHYIGYYIGCRGS